MRVKSWCWQIAKLAQCGDLGNQPVSLQLSARTCYWRFGAVVRWGGFGSGPNKGGEIDLIVLCVDFFVRAVHGSTCKNLGIHHDLFLIASLCCHVCG